VLKEMTGSVAGHDGYVNGIDDWYNNNRQND